MNDKLKSIIEEMVRDFTAIGSRPKSEVRRRIEEYGASEREAGKEEAKQLSNTALRGGKLSQELISFYTDCKRGKSVILLLPEGEVLSPKALEQRDKHMKAAGREEAIREAVEAIKETFEGERGEWQLHFDGRKDQLKDDVRILLSLQKTDQSKEIK